MQILYLDGVRRFGSAVVGTPSATAWKVLGTADTFPDLLFRQRPRRR